MSKQSGVELKLTIWVPCEHSSAGYATAAAEIAAIKDALPAERVALLAASERIVRSREVA